MFFTSVFMPKKIKFEDYEAKTDAMKNLIDNEYSKTVNQELALSKFFQKAAQDVKLMGARKLKSLQALRRSSILDFLQN